MKSPTISVKSTELNASGIFWTSIVLYLFCLYCIFSASAYRNAIAPFASGDTRNRNGIAQAEIEEDAFARRLEERRNAE